MRLHKLRIITNSNKKHIKNLSNYALTTDQINLLSRGLKFIPTPSIAENRIKRQLLLDFENFARQMRLQFIFQGQDNVRHPFYVRSNWVPPVQPSVEFYQCESQRAKGRAMQAMAASHADQEASHASHGCEPCEP